jgi:F-type H+-transporting ATPase subunit alpha
MLTQALTQAFADVRDALADTSAEPTMRDVGILLQIGGGIARVGGLPRVGFEGLVELPDGVLGLAVNLDEDALGVVLLGRSEHLRPGVRVRAVGREADTPVGEALLGRVIDATGRPLDGGGVPETRERRPIERPAPAIMDRAPVSVPLMTGIKAVDAMIPIGRGQRELILGDRQTGKSQVALDAIINQRREARDGDGARDVICIYCAIGQRGTAVARAVQTLRSHDAMAHSIVVAASGEDPPGLQFITPYAATAMGERFMDQGRDVLVVYDDLTRHARAYRELSLLLRRPPGREAFPGDIFYIHSRLLERATHLREKRGGGSLTALPIVETQAQDISAYIPTNLISITDGQIYLSPTLFRKGLLPAIAGGRQDPVPDLPPGLGGSAPGIQPVRGAGDLRPLCHAAGRAHQAPHRARPAGAADPAPGCGEPAGRLAAGRGAAGHEGRAAGRRVRRRHPRRRAAHPRAGPRRASGTLRAHRHRSRAGR